MTENDAPRLVVGVGASAGGLEAFRQFLSALPAETGMAFLLVQHLDPTHKSMLAELLAPCTSLSVKDADSDDGILPNTVYIIRPDTALGVHEGKIELSIPTLHRGVRLPVNHLFQSLARQYGPRSVGIVLSGAGGDGSAGAREIRSAGGLVIAQDPTTCGQPGMPQSAIDTGAVDLVLEASNMPAALERFASLPPGARIEPAVEPDQSDGDSSLGKEQFDQLAAMLEAQVGFDVRVYKRATIDRRVLRRMALAGFEEVPAFLDHLRSQPSEQQVLVRDLLINVTDFFRDPDAFRALREVVVNPLVERTEAGGKVRVWVPGCATGEEAYSIGIEFLDAIEAARKALTLQIFATDVAEDALAVGREAVYSSSIVDRMSQQRVQTYFRLLDGRGYQVRPALRDVVSFAVHDLTKDAPFSRMNLVSCRNVLIYLTPETQQHVLKLLHFALVQDAFLLLSTSESTSPQRELFGTISKQQRIYSKVGASQAISVGLSRTRDAKDHDGSPKVTDGVVTRRGPSPGDLVRRAVLKELAPPTIVVAENGSIIFSHGELAPFLKIPEGENPDLELNAVLRSEIATRARGALYKCRRREQTVSALSSPDGSAARVRITARPANSIGPGVVILSFENVDDGVQRDGGDDEGVETPGQEAVIEQLERELQATREDLRNTVEELETSNEELRSSNEESMSMNEELQSANEELEATSEELRSLNEELTTVNSQLREKVEQLEQAHDDLNNFLASTKIATVFLDERLRIKRFTPAVKEMLSVDYADTGRYVGDIARELLQNGLEQEARQVLEHLTSQAREIKTRSDRWVSRQVLPYRTENRRIEGVVVTFVDITDLKSATSRLELREQQQSVVAQLGLHALREENIEAFMEHVVHEVQQTLRTDLCKIVEVQPGNEKLWLRAGVGWDAKKMQRATEDGAFGSPAGYALQSHEPVVTEDLAGDKRFGTPELLRTHGATSGIACVVRDGDYQYGVLGVYCRETRRFAQEDVHFVQAVANILGSAIGRHHTRMRLAMELGVAHVLAEATDLDDTLGSILDRIGSELSASIVAELWWKDDGEYVRKVLHVTPSSERRRVEKWFGEPSFRAGKGLIGTVLENGQAIWVTDLGNPEMFMRSSAAKALGHVSGIGLPVQCGNDVRGMIGIYSSERLFADDTYLRSLEGIGRSIGEFITGWEADEVARSLAAITESSHDAIVAYTFDGTITKWLAGAEELYRYSKEEMLGASIEQIVPSALLDEQRQINDQVKNGVAVEPVETVRIRKGGDPVQVSVRCSPVRDRSGAVVGISSMERDITLQKEVQEALIEADRQKDEFLAMLGHELRNPLAAIRTAAELLRRRNSNGDALIKRTQEVLSRQAAHMATLLDGLLDVSRIIRGKIILDRKKVDLAVVCRDVAAEVAERSGGSAEIDVRTQTSPVWVEGDPVRLAQIVDNVLSNAVKYGGNEGPVTLSLSVHAEHAILEIRDQGVGIEPDLLPHIFEVFRQSRQNLGRTQGGLGLGLSLVKSLVDLHGGEISAESEGPGQGAAFTVRLPVTEEGPQTMLRPVPADTPLGIVVIEDNEDSAEMIAELLRLDGHTVRIAANGRAGIDLVRELRPDVVLCDLGLADTLTGYDVARSLREDPMTQAIRLVAITGYGRPDDRDRCYEAGFDGHLTKPVDPSELARYLYPPARDQ